MEQSARANNNAWRRDDLPAAMGALIATSVGVALAASHIRKSAHRGSGQAERRRSLAAYLRDHLSGSDVAVRVVDRLRRTHAGTADGQLFDSLFREFEEERGVVRMLLAELGLSSRSLKRIAGRASGSLVSLTSGGEPGEMALFRTLEALSIGVQGKRCMWRALQRLGNLPVPGRRTLDELESMAVRQWQTIEERRRALAIRTFPTWPDATLPGRDSARQVPRQSRA